MSPFFYCSYHGGESNSELGDVNFVHCLTGWLPEPVPLDKLYAGQLWSLLVKLLPNWKLPQPKPPNNEECRGKKGMVAVNCFSVN